jgi:hypothetical protein
MKAALRSPPCGSPSVRSACGRAKTLGDLGFDTGAEDRCAPTLHDWRKLSTIRFDCERRCRSHRCPVARAISSSSGTANASRASAFRRNSTTASSLDVLPLREAMAFLERRSGRTGDGGTQELAETLGHLPLALDHAAAYCKRTQMSFADYAAKASNLIAAVPRGVSYPRSVSATFDLAVSQALEQCAAAEPLMAFFSLCAPERIPMVLIEGAIHDEGERRKLSQRSMRFR